MHPLIILLLHSALDEGGQAPFHNPAPSFCETRRVMQSLITLLLHSAKDEEGHAASHNLTT